MKPFLFLFLLFAVPAIAQTDTTATKKKPAQQSADKVYTPQTNPFQQTGPNLDPTLFGLISRTDTRYEGVQGTPYFLDGWTQGRIDLVNGAKYENVPLKYDARNQNLVLRRDQTRDSIIVFPMQVSQFLLRADDGAVWVFRRFPLAKTNDNDLKDSYFLVLYDGKTSLLKRVTKVFKKADYRDPYSTNVRFDSYKSDYAYFVLKPDNTLVKIKKSKKALFEALNDKGANVEAFAAQEKLEFKTDIDFAKVVKQYDGL
jgi:hypothetical protein